MKPEIITSHPSLEVPNNLVIVDDQADLGLNTDRPEIYKQNEALGLFKRPKFGEIGPDNISKESSTDNLVTIQDIHP